MTLGRRENDEIIPCKKEKQQRKARNNKETQDKEELEEAYGPELREAPYAQVKGSRMLKAVLSQRLRSVVRSEKTCRTWISTYGTRRYAMMLLRQRSAQIAGF